MSFLHNFSLPDDFTPVLRELTFEEGEDTQCAKISITDDDKLELQEEFIVSISTDSESVDLSPDNATITIVDTSSKRQRTTIQYFCCVHYIVSCILYSCVYELICLPQTVPVVGLDMESYTAKEGSSAVFWVKIYNGSLERDVTLNITLQPGTATTDGIIIILYQLFSSIILSPLLPSYMYVEVPAGCLSPLYTSLLC